MAEIEPTEDTGPGPALPGPAAGPPRRRDAADHLRGGAARIRRQRLCRDQHGGGGAPRRGFDQDAVSADPQQGRAVRRHGDRPARPRSGQGRSQGDRSCRDRARALRGADGLRGPHARRGSDRAAAHGAAGGRQVFRHRRHVLPERHPAHRSRAGGLAAGAADSAD